ncbi:MAG TPA: DUF3310 domain-containing protein [Tissierellales bacterium]|nr:DUF3310 domain-containing protein [Tissierellales bacterium]
MNEFKEAMEQTGKMEKAFSDYGTKTGIDTDLLKQYEYGVDSPIHYNKGEYEVIDVIEDWGLNFNLGNVIKYIARCNHKGNKVKDLQKAIWYLQREITSKGE